MDPQHNPDDMVVLLHQEAAYADLGTTRSEPVKETTEVKAPVVFFAVYKDLHSTKRIHSYWATAPPEVRAA